jgi:hypothetical protein
VAAGIGLLGPEAGEGRVQLALGNPNVLGATLVVAATAWAAVGPRRRLVWWIWPLVGIAVLHTGSRTSGAALVAAAGLWFVLEVARRRPGFARHVLTLAALLGAAAIAWQYVVVEASPNLLETPSDVARAPWRHDLAQRLVVIDGAAPGPFEGTLAQRLIAEAEADARGILFQSMGLSEEGVPYVASVYLRSDVPQQVVLSSHLSQVVCDVRTEWQRCVTPVGVGNDVRQRQFHLRTPDRGGTIDVYLFGAQYERGEVVTPFRDIRPEWLPQSMVNRFDLRRVTFLPANRTPTWEAGIELVREAPAWGLGPSAAPAAFRDRTALTMRAPVTYAHHGLIQFVAVHGFVGLGAVIVFLVAVGTGLTLRGWRRLAPLGVALLVLNSWDVTWFEVPVFTMTVLATAMWWRRVEVADPLSTAPEDVEDTRPLRRE